MFLDRLRNASPSNAYVIESFDVAAFCTYVSNDSSVQATHELMIQHQGAKSTTPEGGGRRLRTLLGAWQAIRERSTVPSEVKRAQRSPETLRRQSDASNEWRLTIHRPGIEPEWPV
ncbi:hypothetical protein KIN20_013856 [Parelaphostrongylus tenuis]|uniref:Uncharacterized protein n=1 Tax=Parelaphostrongylus tenuis TaxID=148309 RepID=A0AAD5QL96_PARTN|nr:hypothetical protein KIN20_013856 [Parelaphostrongylus tenuis]